MKQDDILNNTLKCPINPLWAEFFMHPWKWHLSEIRKIWKNLDNITL